MNKLKILQVSGGSPDLIQGKGAVESVILNVSKNLIFCGNDVTVLLAKKSTETNSVSNTENRINIIRLSKKYDLNCLKYNRQKAMFMNLLNGILFAYKVNRYIKNNKFDVIHWHTTFITFINIFLNKNILNRSVFTSHSSLHSVDPSSLDIFFRIKVNIDGYIFRRVSKIIVLNDIVKNKIIHRYKIDSDKIISIPNGVDINIFKSDISATDTKNKFNMNGKFIILFVGRIHKVKGLEYLVKAANIIVNNHSIKNVLFSIIGPKGAFGLEEDYTAELKRLICTYNLDEYFLIPGHVTPDELINFYRVCDVFVLPSLAEACPLVLLEAMSSGKPVIGTNVGCVPNLIEDSWNGFVIYPANENQLSEKIEFLLENPIQINNMGHNSRKIVLEKFDWKIISNKIIEEVYFKIINKI